MGTNCGDHGSPGDGFKNPCDDTLEVYSLPNFCQTNFSLRDSDRDQLTAYCQNLSPFEWTVSDVGGLCDMSDCDGSSGVDFGAGCCHQCCGLPLGTHLDCQRTAFTGDPVICCVEDLKCNPTPGNTFNPANCFSDPNPIGPQQHTCDPTNRDATSPGCQTTMQGWCTGTDLEPNDITWLNRWSGNITLNNGITYTAPCMQNLNRNLYNTYGVTTPLYCGPFPQGLPVTNNGFAYGQQLITDAVAKYTNQGFVLGTLPGSPGYNTFQDTIINICQSNPGICANSLKTAGANLNTTRLTQNPTAAQLFGCYLPDAEYTTYINDYGVPKQCSPMCNTSNTIPLVGPDGITPVPCTNSSCIIDNVTIALSESRVGGSINFSQICQNCSSTVSSERITCNCLISGDSVIVANSQIGGNIDFNQQCTGVIQCFTTDSSGNRVQTPCANTTSPYSQQVALQNQAQSNANNTGFYITLGIVIFAIIIVIIVYILVRRKES